MSVIDEVIFFVAFPSVEAIPCDPIGILRKSPRAGPNIPLLVGAAGVSGAKRSAIFLRLVSILVRRSTIWEKGSLLLCGPPELFPRLNRLPSDAMPAPAPRPVRLNGLPNREFRMPLDDDVLPGIATPRSF